MEADVTDVDILEMGRVPTNVGLGLMTLALACVVVAVNRVVTRPVLGLAPDGTGSVLTGEAIKISEGCIFGCKMGETAEISGIACVEFTPELDGGTTDVTVTGATPGLRANPWINDSGKTVGTILFEGAGETDGGMERAGDEVLWLGRVLDKVLEPLRMGFEFSIKTFTGLARTGGDLLVVGKEV